MDQLSTRNLRILGIVIAVLLVALAFYPGTLTSPHVQENPQQYTNTLVSEWEGDDDPAVYQYGELSPVAQEIFDRTRNRLRYTPDICRGFMLICDGYYEDELPDEFTYTLNSEAYVIIENGNESYILQTGTFSHGDYFIFTPSLMDALYSFLILLTVAAVTVAVVVKNPNERMLKGTVGGGAMVGAFAFLAPYLELLELITASSLRLLLIGAYFVIMFLLTSSRA